MRSPPLAVSTGIGAVNGFVAVWLRVEPFITTLGTGAVVSGLALYVASTPKGRASRWWTDFYTREIGPVPLLVLIAVAIGAVLWVMLTRTAWGRHVYAVGGDPEVARVSGLHADRVALSAYVVAGLLAGHHRHRRHRLDRRRRLRAPLHRSSSRRSPSS